MRLKLDFKISGQKVIMKMVWDGEKKTFWWHYPPDVALSEANIRWLALNFVMVAYGICRDWALDVEITGVPLVVEEVELIWGTVLRERRAAYHDQFYNDGRAYFFPELNITGLRSCFNPQGRKKAIPSRSGSFFSFGKESQLVKELAEKVLCPNGEHVLGFTDMFILNRPAYTKRFSNYPNLLTVKTNHNHISGMVKKRLPDVFDSKLSMTGVRIDLMHLPVWLPVIESRQIAYWMMGNEYDATSRHVLYNSEFHYNFRLFSESMWYEWLGQHMVDSVLDGSKFFSPISPIYENVIFTILLEEFPDSFKNICACWRVGAKTDWCANCEKCLRYYAMYLLNGVKPPFKIKKPWYQLWPEQKQQHSDMLFTDDTFKYHLNRFRGIPPEFMFPLEKVYRKYAEMTEDDTKAAPDVDFNLINAVPMMLKSGASA